MSVALKWGGPFVDSQLLSFLSLSLSLSLSLREREREREWNNASHIDEEDPA